MGYRTKQRSGTCSKENLDAVLHHQYLLKGGFEGESPDLGSLQEQVRDYKLFHLDEKVQILNEVFTRVKNKGGYTKDLSQRLLVNIYLKTKKTWKKREAYMTEGSSDPYKKLFNEIADFIKNAPKGVLP
jgi:hypothetical protein